MIDDDQESAKKQIYIDDAESVVVRPPTVCCRYFLGVRMPSFQQVSSTVQCSFKSTCLMCSYKSYSFWAAITKRSTGDTGYFHGEELGHCSWAANVKWQNHRSGHHRREASMMTTPLACSIPSSSAVQQHRFHNKHKKNCVQLARCMESEGAGGVKEL